MAMKMIAVEATTATVGTTTVYTVPANKAANVRVTFRVQANASGPTTFSINAGNCLVWQVVIPQGTYAHTVVPLDNLQMQGGFATISSSLLQTATTGTTVGVGGPIGVDYILAATQTVTYTISGNAAQSVYFRVAGLEDDAV